MSWSFSIGPVEIGKFSEAADSALQRAPISAQNEGAVDAAKQATEAAKAIVASGVIGPHHLLVAVSLSGHANPHHLPQSGWSNDQVSIHISQVSEA
ncbi:MAG: hypothetical protein M1335_07025 [Chloroflexi bacterium]|nr:hypothetical protein [Chloroflexota bacterium]